MKPPCNDTSLFPKLQSSFAITINSGFFGGNDERIRVSCVGDSLTYGSGVIKTREMDSYPAQLQIKLGTSHLVSNFGVRNATASADGDLPYIDSDAYKKSLESKPDIVLLMLGTNDSKTYNWKPASYEASIRSLVQTYKGLDTNPTVYLMISPYCFSLDGSDVAEYQVQPKIVAGEIRDIVEKVAAEEERCALVVKDSFGCPFVPYLTYNYDKIFVVDPRFADFNLLETLKNDKVDDVIIINAIYGPVKDEVNDSIKKLLNG